MGISCHSVQRILHNDLKLFPYKITVLHKLTNQKKQRRLEYALWAEGKDENSTHGFPMKLSTATEQ